MERRRSARDAPPRRALFVRTVRYEDASSEPADPRAVHAWLTELDRTGRLVAAGERRDPAGHWLLFRATDLQEARRALRSDPFVTGGNPASIEEWAANRAGTGVNLDPPPPRGAGRLTVLHRISVFVRDHRVAVAWYLDVLGLTVRAEDPATEYYELSLGAGSAALVLVQPRPAWGRDHYEEGRRRIGIATGITFQTDNVEALALRLEHAGRPALEGPRTEPWGGRSLRFADPDGNEFVALDAGPRTAETVPRPPRRRHRRKSETADAPELYLGHPSAPSKR